MKQNRIFHFGLVAAVAALAACNDSTSVSLVTDTEISEDVAAAAGEGIAADVGAMNSNESSVGGALPGAPSFDLFPNPSDLTLNITRTRTCYDDQGAAQASCNATTTASITFVMTLDGNVSLSHSGPRGTDALSIAVHRARNWTISGLLGTEVSRTHNGSGTSRDTTSFSGTHNEVVVSSDLRVASNDTVSNVTFNLPRATNPWPVSGTIVRSVSGNIEVTRDGQTETRSFSRRVVVTFPADAQGNVSLTINGMSCTLNLATHVVANCTASA